MLLSQVAALLSWQRTLESILSPLDLYLTDSAQDSYAFSLVLQAGGVGEANGAGVVQEAGQIAPAREENAWEGTGTSPAAAATSYTSRKLTSQYESTNAWGLLATYMLQDSHDLVVACD